MKMEGFLNIFGVMNVGLWQYDTLSESFFCDQKFLEIFSYGEYVDCLKTQIKENMKKSNFILEFEFGESKRIFECASVKEGDVYSGTIKEITDTVEEKEELHELAYYDTLTGLRNRTSCLNYLDELEDKKGFYLYIDIHKFKTINDTFGHRVGDDVLIRFSEILKHRVDKSGVIFRLSGDEFFIHMQVTKFPIVKKVLRFISTDFANLELPGLVNLKFNVGIVKYKNSEDVSSILQKSDLAMYVAKHSKNMEYVLADNEVMDKFIDEVEYNIRMNKILNFGNNENDSVVVRRTSDSNMVNSLVNSIYKNN